MKSAIVFSSALLFFGPASFSQESPTKPAMPPASSPVTGGTQAPCKNIAQACSSAGYKPRNHQNGKGLMADCMRPILMKGSSAVKDVNVSDADIGACRAKRSRMRGQKARTGNSQGGTNPPTGPQGN